MINAALMLISKISIILRGYNDGVVEMFNGVQMKMFWLVLFHWTIWAFVILLKGILTRRG